MLEYCSSISGNCSMNHIAKTCDYTKEIADVCAGGGEQGPLYHFPASTKLNTFCAYQILRSFFSKKKRWGPLKKTHHHFIPSSHNLSRCYSIPYLLPMLIFFFEKFCFNSDLLFFLSILVSVLKLQISPIS